MTTDAGSPADARRDIEDVLVRYATAIDRKDWSLLRSCFTEECEADYGDIGAWSSGSEITEWMAQMHEPLGPTLHRITNPVIEVLSDTANSRCYVDALVMGAPGSDAANRVAGHYDDELVRTAAGWRIARRRFTLVHLDIASSS